MPLFSALKKPVYPADADGPPETGTSPLDALKRISEQPAKTGSLREMQEPSTQPGGRPMPAPTDIPVQHVVSMRNQGMSNNQIIQNLQRFGYSLDQVNNALNQADIKVGIYPAQSGSPPQPSFAGPAGGMGGGLSGDVGGSMGSGMGNAGSASSGGGRGFGAGAAGSAASAAPRPGFGPGPAPPGASGLPAGVSQRSSPSFSSPSFSPSPGPAGDELSEEISESDERMHEIAESIIEEKWNELMESVTRIIEWKDSIETRMAKAEQQLTDLRGSFDKLHEGVLGKLGDYDKGISTVTVEIKALEKVFQKILPGFVENVHELSRITEKMKGK